MRDLTLQILDLEAQLEQAQGVKRIQLNARIEGLKAMKVILGSQKHTEEL